MVLLNIEGNESIIDITFSQPIELNRNCDYEIGLNQCTLWYSWHNISDKFENNTFQYRKDEEGGWVNVTIPNGMYNDDCLNYFLCQYFDTPKDKCPIVISSNPASMRFVIILQEKYIFRFNSDLYQILGFEKESEISKKINEGTKLPNITRSVDKIQIHCSLVNSSIVNKSKSDVIWTFVPNTEPGCQIVENPRQLIYLPINTNDFIYSLRMAITDQLGRPIDLNGDNVGYVLHLRKA